MAGVSTINRVAPSIAGSFSVMSVPNPTCKVATSLAIAPFWDENFKAPFEARILSDGSMRSDRNGSPSASLIALAKDKFFGTFFSNGDAIASPLVVKYYHKYRNTTTAADFIRRRDNGEIVINPLDVCTVKLTASPALPRLNATKSSTFVVGHQLPLDGYPAFLETGCTTRPRGYVTGSMVAALGAAHQNGLGSIAYHDWWSSGQNLQFPLGSAELYEMGGLIAYALSQEARNEGLLTTNLCAARAGAVDFSTALAELPETMGSVYAAIKFILNAYVECKKEVGRLNNRRDPEVLTIISDLWLQYRYAIMPNVYLIEDTMAYLAKSQRVYATERGGQSAVLSNFNVNGWSLTDLPYLDRVFVKNRFGAENLSPHLQTNLAVTAWELVPLSFVLDWVFNIGDILGSLTPTYGSVQEAVQYSRRAKETAYLSHPDWIGSPVKVEVDAYKAFPITDIYSEIGFNTTPQMNLKRWLDASALSWSAFKRQIKSTLRSFR